MGNSSRGKIILASASPRRRVLLQAAGYTIEVRPSNADESLPAESLADAVVTLARRKLQAVMSSDLPMVAADTVVSLDGHVLGKPRDRTDACATIARLAGHEHRVVTGVAVQHGTRSNAFSVTTRVWFRQLSPAEIEWYVDTGESMDKAGAYGIQGVGGSLVEHIEGSYSNVVGLPLTETIRALDELV